MRIGSVGVKWRRCLMVLEPDFSEKCNTDTKTEVLIMMSASLEADIYHGRKKKHFVINNTRSYHIQFVINNTSSQKQARPQQASAEAQKRRLFTPRNKRCDPRARAQSVGCKKALSRTAYGACRSLRHLWLN